MAKLSALLGEITSIHNGTFYCLNCFHFFRTTNKLESPKKVSENKDFCEIDTKAIKFDEHH